MRVDSPGGSAAVSEVFYEELLEFGKEKPVVVSMGSMAASGGLMISMAGERVFAGEGTVTGSIGVIMQSLHNEKLLDSLGIGYLLYTTGPDKAAGNPTRKRNTCRSSWPRSATSLWGSWLTGATSTGKR